MNPFRKLTKVRLIPDLFRWRPLRPEEIPVERPPRARAPRGRSRIVWPGDLSHPFPFESEAPPRWDESQF